MVSAVVIEGIRAERHRALRIVAACDMALQAFGAIVEMPAPDPEPAPGPRAPRQRKATVFHDAPATPAARGAAVADGGKAGTYAAVILKSLAHFSKAPHYSADTAVLRREVAKACGVNQDKDDRFKGDIHNALGKLQREKKIERSGSVWALVDKPDEN